jgi:hypothetical protein
VPGYCHAGTARDLVIQRPFACPADRKARHNRADAFHTPDGLLRCDLLSGAFDQARESYDPILDRNPDLGRIDARLAIKHVDESSAKRLVVHHLSPATDAWGLEEKTV